MTQKYALVVGCNYPNSTSVNQLHDFINDAKNVHDVLMNRFGYKPTNVELPTDDNSDQNIKPTAANIKATLNNFFSGTAKSGDVVFFFFAGHGTVVPATYTSSGKDEQAIVTCDLNIITSMDFRKILRGVPDGITFVLMADSCFSRGLIDKETEQIGPKTNRSPRGVVNNPTYRSKMIPFSAILEYHSVLVNRVDTPNNVPAHFILLFGLDASLTFRDNAVDQEPLKPDQGILLSGCQPDEFSNDSQFEGIFHGAFTLAVLKVLKAHPGPITHRELVKQARQVIKKEPHYQGDQHPCLYCSNDNAAACSYLPLPGLIYLSKSIFKEASF